MRKQIAVIGSGVAGLFTAYRLLEAGFSVTLVDPFLEEKTASYAALGFNVLKGLYHPRTEAFQILFSGIKKFPHFIDKFSQQTPTAQHKGVLSLYRDISEYRKEKKRVYQRDFLAFYGLSSFSQKATGQFLQEKGLKSNGFLGGFYYPEDNCFAVEDFLRGMLSFLLKQGVCQEKGHVLSLEQDRLQPEKIRLGFASKSFLFDEAILCTGYKTKELLDMGGFFSIPIQEKSGVTYSSQTNFLSESGAFLLRERKISLLKGRISFGPFTQKDTFSPQDMLSLFLPKSPNQPVLIEKQGIRCLTKDRLPVVGFFPHRQGKKGVWACFGFYKNGFYLADACAQTMAAHITGKATDLPGKIFSAQRFFS